MTPPEKLSGIERHIAGGDRAAQHHIPVMRVIQSCAQLAKHEIHLHLRMDEGPTWILRLDDIQAAALARQILAAASSEEVADRAAAAVILGKTKTSTLCAFVPLCLCAFFL